ncbi:hypothetical protein [Flavisericum labens]|uniref:hypothetical protein n=1 Tax=Flavisericum labens TaxID=3377112 RepID=UPI00387B7D08
MDKKEKGNFEFVKESKDDKRNYIFQKDGITKKTTILVITFLVILILAVVFSGIFFEFN